MKKFFKSFLSILCAAIIFSNPFTASATSQTAQGLTSVTAFSNTDPVLVMNYQGTNEVIKVLQFQPNPYHLTANSAYILKDITTSDGYWNVPAGNKFTFNLYLTDDSTNYYFRVLVLGDKQGIITYTDVLSQKYPQFNLPALPYDEKYQFWVVAYTDIDLYMYDGFIRVE